MKSDNGRVLIGQAGSFVYLLALPPCSLCPETPANCITNAGQLPDPVPFYPAPHIPCILEYILHFSFFQYRPLAGKHQDKGLQTNRDMKPPLPVQVLGAITNIVLDLCSFSACWDCQKIGITGAAIATVAG